MQKIKIKISGTKLRETNWERGGNKILEEKMN